MSHGPDERKLDAFQEIPSRLTMPQVTSNLTSLPFVKSLLAAIHGFFQIGQLEADRLVVGKAG